MGVARLTTHWSPTQAEAQLVLRSLVFALLAPSREKGEFTAALEQTHWLFLSYTDEYLKLSLPPGGEFR